MICASIFENLDPAEHGQSVAYTVGAMIYTARLALENDTSGVNDVNRRFAVAAVLEAAEAMMPIIDLGMQQLQMKQQVAA